MDNSPEPKTLTSTEAQRFAYTLMAAVKAQLDIAANARTSARDRADALQRLDRALAALQEATTPT